jgi:hypothetical protein
LNIQGIFTLKLTPHTPGSAKHARNLLGPGKLIPLFEFPPTFSKEKAQRRAKETGSNLCFTSNSLFPNERSAGKADKNELAGCARYLRNAIIHNSLKTTTHTTRKPHKV